AVETVVGGVERPVLVPGNPHITLKRGVFHFGEGLDPIDALAVLAPKALGVGKRLMIEPMIGVLVDFADLRMRRDRDHGPAGHGGGSSSADDAGPCRARCRRRLFRPGKTLQYPFGLARGISGGRRPSLRASPSAPPASGSQ